MKEQENMSREDIGIHADNGYEFLKEEYRKIALNTLSIINQYTYDYRHAKQDIRDIYDEKGRNIPPMRIKSLEK